MIVAVSAALLTLDQSWQLRKFNKLSVRPVLGLYFADAIVGDFSIAIETAGLGPAIIESESIYYAGEKVSAFPTYEEYFEKKGVFRDRIYPDQPVFIQHWSPLNGLNAIDASYQSRTYRVDNDVFRAMPDDVQEYLLCNAPLDMWQEIKYCSLYDECYSASSKGNSVHEVCPMKNGIKLPGAPFRGRFNNRY